MVHQFSPQNNVKFSLYYNDDQFIFEKRFRKKYNMQVLKIYGKGFMGLVSNSIAMFIFIGILINLAMEKNYPHCIGHESTGASEYKASPDVQLSQV